MKIKLIICIILTVFLSMLVCAAVFAADDWYMFRRTPARTGATDVNVLGPHRPSPVWIFPYHSYLDNNYGARVSANFGITETVPGTWIASDATDPANRDTIAYNDDYMYTDVALAAPPLWEGAVVKATWQFLFPAGTLKPVNHYYVSVWIPKYQNTGGTNHDPHSTDAHYTVLRNGVPIPGARFTVDQTEDGRWVRLGNRVFSIGYDETIQLVLTNETEAPGQVGNAVVVADVAKLEIASGNFEANTYLDNDYGTRNSADFDAAPLASWIESDPDDRDYNAFSDDYLYANATYTASPAWEGAAVKATWQFPLLSFNAVDYYYLSVWLPTYDEEIDPPYHAPHSTDAHYAVVKLKAGVVTSVTKITVDQAENEGWVLLGNQPFSIGDNDTIRVVLTNETEIAEQNGAAVVVADTVRLEMASGGVESYASPVLAPRGAGQDDDLVITSLINVEPLPATARQEGIRDIGVVYGVYAEDNNGSLAVGDSRGVPAWRFPANPDNWISGGIFSSATVATMPAVGGEAAVVPAMDGSVYVIRTSNGTIFWKGPGYFAEDNDVDSYNSAGCSMTADAGWVHLLPTNPLPAERPHPGYQGSGYWHKQAEAIGSGNAVTWSSGAIGEAGAYQIYAWIPPSTADHQYISDAKYEVTIGTTTTTVTVNQGRGGGGWVRIGFKHQVGSGDDISVVLKNETGILDGTGNPPATAYVAADAMKFVPFGIGSFEYSSPLVSGNDIYVCSAGGQVYKLNVASKDPVWTYPDLNDAATPHPIGAVYASPAFDGTKLYVGSSDGHVYALDTDGNEEWVYPTKDPDVDDIQELAAISSTTLVHGSILYVGIGSGDGSGFAHDTSGRVVALDATGGSAMDNDTRELWWYPSDPDDAVNGDNSVGSFIYSSPMLMNLGGIDSVIIGSADGNMYGLNSGTGASLWLDPIDVRSTMYSSAAGTIIPSYWRTDNTTLVPDANVPMAYIGTNSGQLTALDLGLQKRDWWWNLYGGVRSSPALCHDRIYVADTGGFTWAFSARDVSGNAEGWNIEIGGEPDASGSESEDDDGIGRDADPQIDVFTRQEYEDIKAEIAASQGAVSAITEEDFHLRARPADANGKYIYEWGEKVYFIAWNLLDPNYDPKAAGDIVLPGDPDGFLDKTKSTVKIKFKSKDSGSDSGAEETQNVTEKGYYIVGTAPNQKPVYYAIYVYSLDGSSSNKTQTPGTTINVSIVEEPNNQGNSGASDSSGENYVPDRADDTNPQAFSINNPLGIVYNDPTRAPIALSYTIGVDAAFNTARKDASGNPYAGENGSSNPPYIRSEPATHGVNTKGQTLIVCDRSLLGASGKRIDKLRVDRRDLRWTGGANRVINGIPVNGSIINGVPVVNPLGWEVMPPENGPNASMDYPNVTARQVSCIMGGSAMNPVQEQVVLVPPVLSGITELDGSEDDTHKVGANPMGISVSVPQFQPANMPDDATLDLSYNNSGYTGRLFVFVDSDGDGHLDRPGELGGRGSSRAEAYREVISQAHVMADPRVEVVEKTLDIGQVPHGFGFTLDTVMPQPRSFYSNFANNLADFGSWFKPFTAYNQGNVNLIDLRFAKRTIPATPYPGGALGLTSDTVYTDPASGFGFIPGYWGSLEPHSCVVSALDPEHDNDGSIYSKLALNACRPGVPNIPCNRTFHKARVGETAPQLKLPDIPERILNSNPLFATYIGNQKPPSVSVSVPVGQPVGTYSGKFTLYEDFSRDDHFNITNESVGNPLMSLVVGVTEARMTDGSTAGSKPHVDGLSPTPTADMTPVAYRDPANNKLHMIWSSTRNGSTPPVTTDPSYLYISSLPPPMDFSVKTNQAAAQWWQPVTAAGKFPATANISTFFPEPVDTVTVPMDPYWGAPGSLLPNTVKFTSPSVAISTGAAPKTWMLFGAQAYKDTNATTPPPTTPLPGNEGKTLESRIWYTELTDGVPGDPSPWTYDWTMPKYGIRGLAATYPNNPSLWAFWYGGSNEKWRIYYNVKRDMSTAGPADTNTAQLPIPNGLSWTAEPSPVFWPVMDPDPNVFDVVYSGHSTYHKNSDIYLSRYKPGADVAAVRDGGHWPMTLQRLQMRDINIWNNGGTWSNSYTSGANGYTVLRRDPAKGIWYSRDVDWDPTGDIYIWVFPDRNDLTVAPEQVTAGSVTKDKQTGAWAYTYDSNPALRSKYRALVVDPAAGTVRFMNAPGNNAMVVARFRPRAYRLTTDSAADVSPFALLDSGPNPNYINGKMGNPFVNCGSAPPTDRLWMFWRRPALDKPGSGIHYKTYRYMVHLNEQMAAPNLTTGDLPVGVVVGAAGGIEIDWVNNRLYFTSADASKIAQIDYLTSSGATRTEYHVIELAEEMGPKEGSAFGNLTRLMVNEGQVSAFKDPLDNKIWAFWTSTRSGNTDVYYEAISPRFSGVDYRESY